ncbi:hypothetical protein D3C72_2016160 [compost metagenome]
MLRTICALSANGLLLYFVIAIMVAPFFLAISIDSRISMVLPEFEMKIATSPLPSSVAAVIWLCPSV